MIRIPTGMLKGIGRGQWGRNRLFVLGIAGIGVRALLWWSSIGSNDVVIWSLHAQHVLAIGLARTYETYQSNPQFNHPPLVGLYAAQVWLWSSGSIWTFAHWLKLPGLVGEALVMWTLSRCAGLRAWAVYAWLPAAILVSSFHGNTDCLCAALVLLAAVAFDRESYFLSGLLWSASINVKVLPLILLPLVFLGAPSRKAFLRLACGFALGMAPFLPPALVAGKAMYQNVVLYNPRPENWGLMALLNRGTGIPALRRLFQPMREWWMAYARYIILMAVFGVALLSVCRRKMLMTEQAALGMSLLLVLAPGFGVQYVAYATPLLCFVDLPAGVRWGWTSGIFIGGVYWMFRGSGMPLRSTFTGPFGPIVVGLVAWAVLVHFLWAHLRTAFAGSAPTQDRPTIDGKEELRLRREGDQPSSM